jgi:hypothetical protein
MEEEARIETVLKKLEKVREECKQSLSEDVIYDDTIYTNTTTVLTDLSSISTNLSGSEENIDEFEDHPEILKYLKK